MKQKNRATLQKGVARVIVSVRLIGGLQGAAWKAPARNAFYRRVRHRKKGVAQVIVRARLIRGLQGAAWKAYSSSILSIATKASCGIFKLPIDFIRFLPSFCFSSNLRLREISPP